MRSTFRLRLNRALTASAYLLVILAAFEGTIELALRYPQVAPWLYRPTRLISHLKNYYLGHDRSIVQFRHDCAQYDDRLTYRLRPGHCTVANREHTVEYAVNRAGLRDSDAALENPSIIVVGDSFAMGWGVAEQETVASRLGALTGARVLNAAISSYETVREIELLRELVRPATKYVVIAYCDNDYDDDWSFVRTGIVPRLSLEEYQRVVARHERSLRYYPFKHLAALTRSAWRELIGKPPQPAILPRPGFAAMNFLAILDNHRELLRGRNLIVLEVNGFNHNSPAFTIALRNAAARSDLLKELASMHAIDASSLLTDDDYFLIDDHPRASGHEKIAREVAAIVNGESRWRVEPAASVPIAVSDGGADGGIERAERKGALTVIQGWAQRRSDGAAAERVALLRDGAVLLEAEPVLPHPDIGPAPGPAWSGFALAIASDRLAGAKTLEVVGIWPDGRISPIGGLRKLDN